MFSADEWRATAAVIQAVGVVASLGWAAYTFATEAENKRIERTKVLVDNFMGEACKAKRMDVRKILAENIEHLDAIVGARNSDWKEKREKIKALINDYEIALMFANKGYYNKKLLAELYGDAIAYDYVAAKEFIRLDREKCSSVAGDYAEFYSVLETFSEQHLKASGFKNAEASNCSDDTG